ncbi:tetratricopeptide repeat protein [Streptomyces mirabilis]|uniref:tetratricopeptide repeat protein n=1 Tax=Streptomyces mirabilis TaxID=68239 RepID=UPI00364F42E6
MSRTPDFFEDLRRVGTLKKALLGGRPSDNALARIPRPAVSRDTVGAWLRGQRFPQQLEPLWAVLEEILAECARQGVLDSAADEISGESVAELLAEGRWRRTWRAERQRRTQSNQEDAERQQGRKSLEDEERRTRQAALVDRPRPVRSWTPKRLGVHPAIPGHPATPGGTGFALPAYVPRPHDEGLRTRLSAAVTDSESLLVVVRGESCTGKTRTAVESLTAMPDDFHLLFPTDADSLLAMLAADALGPRTVLWLNEAQHYLDSTAGEAASAALLRRLDGEGPFIVLATLWPDHDKTFTTAPAPGKEHGDPHRQARTLLAQAHYIYLPRSFADHLDAVRRMARHDASLASALEAGGTDVTQILAAGPDLVAHYEYPEGPHGISGQALVSAAMDAYRLGVTGPLPLAFLHDAAPGYLTGGERAAVDTDDWFPEALNHAQTRIKQIIRPLQNVPHSSRMGALPGVVSLADYLQQHGRRSRQPLCPPATFWNAATHHLTSPDDLTRLAEAAYKRHRLRHAADLYRAAADAGNTSALLLLAEMREEACDRQGAERLYRAAADAGNTKALAHLAWMRDEAGDPEGAEQLARHAADAGDPGTLQLLAEKWEEAGDRQGAERLYRAAADARSTKALTRLAGMREEAGDPEGAEQLARHAADDAGNTSAPLRLEVRDREGAEGFHRAAAGKAYPPAQQVEMWERAGDPEGAERLARHTADAGDPRALVQLASVRGQAGDWQGAERLYRAAADAGSTWALIQLGSVRGQAGDWQGAERLYRAAADAGDIYALTLLARMRGQAGDPEGAERLARQAAAAGNPDALPPLAGMREEAGDPEGAERLWRAAADTGCLWDAFNEMPGRWPYGLEADGSASGPWEQPEPRIVVSGPS